MAYIAYGQEGQVLLTHAACQTDSLRSTVDGSQKMRKTDTSVKI
jgi:hypothetical protein